MKRLIEIMETVFTMLLLVFAIWLAPEAFEDRYDGNS